MRDRWLWFRLRRLWPAWTHAPVVVKPETVVSRHPPGFGSPWRFQSRPKGLVRPIINDEIRALIRQMAEENPKRAAPRIHGELLKLQFEIPERAISRYIKRQPPPDQIHKLWATFLRNHREPITAIDFFTVPTLTLRALDRFFAVEHPTSSWMVQQLREAFPRCSPYR